MSLVLYYGSGSPYAWRVQLALERKAVPYELKVLSFSAGDTRKPEFVALNPRHRVPTIVHDDFVLYESNAIVEYLDEAFPATGAPLFPGDVRTRALVRRLIAEVDSYFDHAIDPLTTQAFGKKPEERDAQGDRRRAAGRRRRGRHVHQVDARRVFGGTPVGGRFRALSARRIHQALAS
jgi:glutathione S-transferase